MCSLPWKKKPAVTRAVTVARCPPAALKAFPGTCDLFRRAIQFRPMSLAERFPASVWIWRRLTSPSARRSYISIIRWSPAVIFLLLVAISIAARLYTFTLTRRIHAILSGLEELKIDQTTEEEMLRTVPYLDRNVYGRRVGTSTERTYYVWIANKNDKEGKEKGVPFVHLFWSRPSELPSVADRLAYWLGYRYFFFGAHVVLLDGKVSRVGYSIGVGRERPRWLISVDSYHGFYASPYKQIVVSRADDESPQYRIEGNEQYLDVSYTFDAPRDLTSHVFQADLSCFWGLFGCRDARRVAPLVWQDNRAIAAAALARLKSNNPCPDRILAGRVRYLPDASVVLLEVNHARTEKVKATKPNSKEAISDYRVLEVLHGDPQAKGGHPKYFDTWITPGSRILMFAGCIFDSCAVVPATPSALSTVRNTVPAPKRAEDEPPYGIL